MKKILVVLVLSLLASCTSNTIFEKPEDLIPKDTMKALITDMIIASSAKYTKNMNNEKKLNYMPFVYEKYKIDSLRFSTSNTYYVSEIEDYQKMMEDVKKQLELQKKEYANIKNYKDSVRRDSIKKSRVILRDSLFLNQKKPIKKEYKEGVKTIEKS